MKDSLLKKYLRSRKENEKQLEDLKLKLDGPKDVFEELDRDKEEEDDDFEGTKHDKFLDEIIGEHVELESKK